MDIFFYSPCRPVSYRYLLCGDIYRFYRNPTLKEIHSFIGKGEVLIKHYDIWPCLVLAVSSLSRFIGYSESINPIQDSQNLNLTIQQKSSEPRNSEVALETNKTTSHSNCTFLSNTWYSITNLCAHFVYRIPNKVCAPL